MNGWRERAADILTKQREIAAKMKSALGPGTSDFILLNFSRLVSGGAEEAGMKGWRGCRRIPPKCAKARFTRVSRGLAPQVSI
ncbi:MAG: hypothetical protein IJI35_10095 [Kiritimatiellae bacterium]|nr:hypothetical protein [Kiritimatiellia bacterium]